MSEYKIRLRSSERPQFPFSLPLEIWVDILYYFTPLEIIYLGQISRVFRRLRNQDIVWDSALRKLWKEYTDFGVFFQNGRCPSNSIPVDLMLIDGICDVNNEIPQCYNGLPRKDFYCYPTMFVQCDTCETIGYRIPPLVLNNFSSEEMTLWFYMIFTHSIAVTTHKQDCCYYRFTANELVKKAQDAENMCYNILENWTYFMNGYHMQDPILRLSPCSANLTKIFANFVKNTWDLESGTTEILTIENCKPDINVFFKQYKKKRKRSDYEESRQKRVMGVRMYHPIGKPLYFLNF